MTTDPVETLWTDKLQPWLAAREGERALAVRQFLMFGGGGIALGIVIGVVFGEAIGDWAILAVGGPIAVGLTLGLAPLHDLSKRVKRELLGEIAGALALKYSPKPIAAMRFDRFRDYGMVPGHDRRAFEDHFEGKLHGADFELYEAHLERRRQTKNGTRYDTVFRGVLIRIGFPRTVEGITLITRDRGVFNSFEAFGRSFGSRKLERIGLVDPKFEKAFEVYGDDQVSARYMLTPSFMERLLKLEASLKGKNVRALFDADSGQGELLISAETGNQFEVSSLWQPLPKRERVMEIVDEIKLIAAIIDDLVKPSSESGLFEGRE